MRAARSFAAFAAAAALAASAPLACGSTEQRPELTVFAAASLAPSFETYAREFDAAEVLLSFAGSDELAAQLRQGLVPDVYAAANTELPAKLAAEGLLETPRVFAANELVLAVPADSDIASIGELTEPGTALGIGAEGAPIGDYTRALLSGLGKSRSGRILAQVATSEPDVSGIVAKLNQGAIDAGFVYASDVRASGGELRAVELPRRLQPAIAYGIGISVAAEHPREAAQFIDGLIEGEGAEALRVAGLAPGPETEGEAAQR